MLRAFRRVRLTEEGAMLGWDFGVRCLDQEAREEAAREAARER